MDALYQLSYVGTEGNRIVAAPRLSGAVGKADRSTLTRRRAKGGAYAAAAQLRGWKISGGSAVGVVWARAAGTIG
jgi:hypothetical protein